MVVVVVDASNLQRNLYLVSQLIELGRPMVVALNMTDVAERRGQPVSATDLRAANYTQLVWGATKQFGCGKAVCKDGTVIVICNYDPKGNVVGEKPY